MLRITIPSDEIWDEKKSEFIQIKGQTLQLEHSLVSISKWESKWNKPFFSKQEKTMEETIDYIKCMTLTQNVRPEIYNCLTNNNLDEISAYIKAPMTATRFYENKKGGNRGKQLTSELIYYYMIALNIPIECQKWHINRLFTLIKVCDIENCPPKKMGRREVMRRYSAINAARRKQLNTKG